MPADDQCSPAKIFNKYGIKATVKRQAVLNTILRQKFPFSVNQIFQGVSRETPLDLVTVYRIMKLFCEKAVLREVATREGNQIFELACEHHPEHPHFICKKCHKIDCLKIIDLKQLKQYREYAREFQISGIQLNLSGICQDCREKEEK